MSNPIQTDVVIIGGGLAGLSAALRIADTNQALPPEQQIKYVVLEADPVRLGGRTWTRGVDMDFGGGYIGATQTQIQYLIRRFQLPTMETFLPQTADFKWLYQSSTNEFTRFPGNNPLAFPGGVNAVALLLRLDSLTMEVRNHLADPSQSALAGLDQQTVADWIKDQRDAWDQQQAHPAPNVDPDTVGMSPATAEVFVTSVRSAFSLEPREISMFYLLYYAATAGGYSALVDVAGGAGAAEATRFSLGTASLVAKLQTAIDPKNIVTGARATKIAYDATGATVSCEIIDATGKKTDERIFRAKRVIVAMAPPDSIKALSYDPPLDKSTPEAAARYRLCQAAGQALGRTIKGFVRFERPFWRERGLMGFLLSAGLPVDKNPLDWTLDNVWVDQVGNQPDRYSLMTFIVGDSASYWSKRSKDERAQAVIDHLKRVYRFDDAELLDPAHPTANYEEENWPARGIGAPDAMMPPKTLALYSALRTPIGPIHWAGSESSTEWCGYMNGAIDSGFRASSEALRAIWAAAAVPGGALPAPAPEGDGPPDGKPPRGTTPPVAPKKAA